MSKGRPPTTTREQELYVLALRDKGLSLQMIAAETGLTLGIVRRIVQGGEAMSGFDSLTKADLAALRHQQVRLADNWRELPVHPNWTSPERWAAGRARYAATLRDGGDE